MRKVFKHVHLWLSLPAGIFIVVMCLTGAVMVFQQEIQAALAPGFYKVGSGTVDRSGNAPVALSLDSLASVAGRELASEGKSISSVTVSEDPEATVLFSVSGQKGAYMAMDPYTAEVTGKGLPASGFFRSVRSLHRWLMLTGTSRTVGRTIMGISTILFSIILISGICIAVPRAWKSMKQWRMSLTATGRKGAWAWWFTSHRAFGWYCAVFLLLMSLTGPMWSFSWYRKAVASVFGVEMGKGGHQSKDGARQPKSGAHQGHGGPQEQLSEESEACCTWDAALSEIRGMEPDLVSVTLGEGTATVKTRHHHKRASDSYRFDNSGKIVSVTKYEDAPSSSKVMGYAFILHAGLWGGWPVKLLYLIACSGGAYLAISGYWLYIRRVFFSGKS